MALILPFCRRPEWGILQRNCSLPLTHTTSYQAGKLFSSQHVIPSSNWCVKTHRTRNCLTPSPVEIKIYIKAPQSKRLLTLLTNHPTLIQSSTCRKLSGSIYWSGPPFIIRKGNILLDLSLKYLQKMEERGDITGKANFL